MVQKRSNVTALNPDYMEKYQVRRDREKMRKQRLIRRLIAYAAIAIIVFGFLGANHMRQVKLHKEKEQQYAELKAKQAELKKEEKRLNDEIALLKDEDYVLEIARTNYFFSKKGEMIFKVPNEDPSY